MKSFFQSLLVLSLVAVMGQGCNPIKNAEQRATEAIAERIIEANSDGEVDVDFSENEVNFKTKDGDGQMRFGDNVELPPDFPNDVPQYAGAKYVSAYVSNEGKTAIANFRTNDASEEVQAWFKSELERDGFSLDAVFQMGAALQLYEKGDVKITVQTQPDEDEGYTVVSLQRAE